MSRKYEITKRIIDVLVGTLGLVLCAPIITLAAMAIKYDSKGSVFFRSRRAGRHGGEFDLFKLRTMQTEQDPDAIHVTSARDHRITRIGRILRNLKIDELPQLLNVVRGDLSLIGPRPEAPRYVACFPDAFEKILKVRPGLSDRATLAYFDEEFLLSTKDDPESCYMEIVLPVKIGLNLKYIENRGPGEDFKMLLHTVIAILRRVGAFLGRVRQ